MNTDDLIERLAKHLPPVKPLWRPGRRAAVWFLGATLYVGILAAALFRPDGGAFDTRLLIPQLAAIATGVLAATAAFATVVPGYRRHVLVWPAIGALVWLGALIAGGQQQAAGTTLAAPHEWLCVALIVVGGAPLLAVIAAMLRRGAPLNPAVTAALAAIAVGALANVGACVSLPHASHKVTLVWHGGAVLMLTLVSIFGARFVLTWDEPRRSSPVTTNS